jgi:hypothetical protein
MSGAENPSSLKILFRPLDKGSGVCTVVAMETTTQQELTADQFHAMLEEGQHLTAPCPLCSKVCKVRPAMKQATRQSGPIFLGCWSGYCGEMACQMGFNTTDPQMALAA